MVFGVLGHGQKCQRFWTGNGLRSAIHWGFLLRFPGDSAQVQSGVAALQAGTVSTSDSQHALSCFSYPACRCSFTTPSQKSGNEDLKTKRIGQCMFGLHIHFWHAERPVTLQVREATVYSFCYGAITDIAKYVSWGCYVHSPVRNSALRQLSRTMIDWKAWTLFMTWQERNLGWSRRLILWKPLRKPESKECTSLGAVLTII